MQSGSFEFHSGSIDNSTEPKKCFFLHSNVCILRWGIYMYNKMFILDLFFWYEKMEWNQFKMILFHGYTQCRLFQHFIPEQKVSIWSTSHEKFGTIRYQPLEWHYDARLYSYIHTHTTYTHTRTHTDTSTIEFSKPKNSWWYNNVSQWKIWHIVKGSVGHKYNHIIHSARVCTNGTNGCESKERKIYQKKVIL